MVIMPLHTKYSGIVILLDFAACRFVESVTQGSSSPSPHPHTLRARYILSGIVLIGDLASRLFITCKQPLGRQPCHFPGRACQCLYIEN